MSVFRAYDIRGIYPEEINEEGAYKIGRSIVIFLKPKQLALGYDMRKSSPGLFKALAKGITDQGCDVVDIGMCTTPMLHFAVAKYGYDGGVMVSASHNPPQYNGFKIDKKAGIMLSEETGLKEIEKIYEKGRFKEAKKGKIIGKNVLGDYMSHILNFSKNIKGLKVVADYGNGVGAISAKPLLAKLDIEVVSMYEEPDDTFPNHIPNPVEPKNLKDLQDAVKRGGADLGISFDGDADRCGFVDENGRIISADYIFSIFAENELKEHPNQKVYYDLRFSRIVGETIGKNKGIPVVLRVGNPFYKEALSKGGVLAGEFSWHVMFKENFGIDDGLFSAAKLMGIMCRKNKPLSELAKPFMKYFKSEEINLGVEDKGKKIKELEREFSDGKISHIDGLSVEYADWWFNVRKSNTEPLLRLNIEADTKQRLEEMKARIIKIAGG